MPSVSEILKQSGMTDEQIAALDAKVTGAFTQVLSTATQERETAELERRKVAATFEQEINPALDKWANDSANLTAERDYYKALAEKAKEGGFVPTTTPFTPSTTATTTPATRDNGGRFVAGANPVPGSPQYMTKEEGFRAVTSAQWFVSEYMRLHNGAPPPEDMEKLSAEANEQRMNFRTYVEKKFDFQAKREQIKADEQKKHDDKIRAEALAENDKKWAEKIGNNPNIRQAEVSRFSDVTKAVKEGTRPDPLSLSKEQRHAATRNVIQREIATAETVQ